MTDWTSEKLQALAEGWFKEVRTKDRGEQSTDDHADAVVLMNFTASTEVQWEFIQLAVATATDESELSALAAGPFEHLMGFQGEAFIDRVENIAKANFDFRKMISSSWRHTMSDDVWARIQAIQAIAKSEA